MHCVYARVCKADSKCNQVENFYFYETHKLPLHFIFSLAISIICKTREAFNLKEMSELVNLSNKGMKNEHLS